jgi:hypothetical protein
LTPSPALASGKNLVNGALSLVFLKIRPREAIDENLFQWVLLAAHSRFYLTFKKLSSWVNDWSKLKLKVAAPWAIEYLFSIFFKADK